MGIDRSSLASSEWGLIEALYQVLNGGLDRSSSGSDRRSLTGSELGLINEISLPGSGRGLIEALHQVPDGCEDSQDLFLMPGFTQVGYYYYFSKSIQRSLVYGDHPRNRFDLYVPEGGKPRSAVIFITGGAWVIGYMAWGALLARQLVQRNVIVACFDYRNFPQGRVSNMLADVSRGIGPVCKSIVDFGRDPDKIVLVGQSAGAHLGACALLIQAKKQIIAENNPSQDPDELDWKASQMKAFLAISGGYNLTSLTEHFHKRGLYKSMFLRIMEGEESLATCSPECIV